MRKWLVLKNVYLSLKISIEYTKSNNLNLVKLVRQTATMADVADEGPKPSKRAQRKLKRLHAKERRKEYKQQNKGLTKNKDPGFDTSLFNLTDYYFENGLRKVYPYYFTFSTYAKQRWVGKTILDVFVQDFHGTERDEYIQDINAGRVKVSGKHVTTDYVVKNNQFLEHTLHRHENPVSGTPIEIIADDKDVIVINKPASIPCHPCGRYRFNSIAFILGKEYGYPNLRNIYRLDRLTSGVLILAKTAEKTRELEDQVSGRNVQKEYVCRVVGEFPDGEIVCDEPLEVIDHKITLFRVKASGKPSKTVFKKRSYNGKTSVVKCYPLTGRTHQIRVHLQYLGYPIVNDPLYNSPAFGPNKGKAGDFWKSEKELCAEIQNLHNVGLWCDGENPLYYKRLKEIKESKDGKYTQSSTEAGQKDIETSQDLDSDTRSSEPQEKRAKIDLEDESPGFNIASTNDMQEKSDCEQGTSCDNVKCVNTSNSDSALNHNDKARSIEYNSFDESRWIPDENCSSCRKKYLDPEPSHLIMYLHALRYSGPDWEYKTELPEWAKDDWKDETT